MDFPLQFSENWVLTKEQSFVPCTYQPIDFRLVHYGSSSHAYFFQTKQNIIISWHFLFKQFKSMHKNYIFIILSFLHRVYNLTNTHTWLYAKYNPFNEWCFSESKHKWFFSFHFVKICRMLCYYFKSFTKINNSMVVVLYTTQWHRHSNQTKNLKESTIHVLTNNIRFDKLYY